MVKNGPWGMGGTEVGIMTREQFIQFFGITIGEDGSYAPLCPRSFSHLIPVEFWTDHIVIYNSFFPVLGHKI